MEDLRVDRYRLIDRIGAGGMGEVYRALDERLGRQVALKLLPAAQAMPPDRQLRFLREAQAASALAHPGIVTVHDIGVHGERPFLVMELVDGQSFAQLAQQGVAPEEALRLVADVADALAAAHARGILHRDIKSANLMRTRDGRAKVVDFGLAKLLDARDVDSSDAVVAWLTSSSPRAPEPPAVEASGVDATVSGTRYEPSASPGELEATLPAGSQDALTRVGDVLGTPAYMAPEQTEGLPATPRSEVFSLGVVLYELLAGRRPFAAPTVAETLRLIAECRPVPPSRAAGRALPEGVDRLVLAALARDPAERPADMRAFAGALRALGGRRPRRGSGLAAAAVAALLAAGILIAARPADGPGFSFKPRDLRRLTFGEGCEEYPSLPAHGGTVFFDAPDGPDYHVYALELSTGRQRRVTSAPGWQYAAAVSPDGTLVAYLAAGEGRTATELVPADGSRPPRRIVMGSVRPIWTPDGRALWAGDLARPSRLDASTGAVQRTLEPPRGFVLSHVRELADGRLLVRLMESGSSGGVGIGLYEPGATEPRWLLRDTVEEVLEPTPDGKDAIAARLTANHRMELWRLPLDGAAAAPIPTSEVPATKGLVLSRGGDRLLWSTCAGIPGFARLDEAGGVLVPLPRNASEDWTDTAPAGVPGTSLLAMSSDRTGRDQPWVIDLAGRQPARLLAIPDAESGYVAVSPDRRWLAYAVFGKGLYVRPFAEDGPARVVATDVGDAPPSFASGGDRLFYEAREPTGIAVVKLAGGRPERILETGARAPSAAAFAARLAYLAPAAEPGAAVPTLHDLASGKSRALSPALDPGAYSAVALAPDAARAAVIVAQKHLVEVSVPSGEVLRRVDAGADQLIGCTYAAGKLIVSRVAWRGDLWIADNPLD